MWHMWIQTYLHVWRDVGLKILISYLICLYEPSHHCRQLMDSSLFSRWGLEHLGSWQSRFFTFWHWERYHQTLEDRPVANETRQSRKPHPAVWTKATTQPMHCNWLLALKQLKQLQRSSSLATSNSSACRISTKTWAGSRLTSHGSVSTGSAKNPEVLTAKQSSSQCWWGTVGTCIPVA